MNTLKYIEYEWYQRYQICSAGLSNTTSTHSKWNKQLLYGQQYKYEHAAGKGNAQYIFSHKSISEMEHFKSVPVHPRAVRWS